MTHPSILLSKPLRSFLANYDRIILIKPSTHVFVFDAGLYASGKHLKDLPFKLHVPIAVVEVEKLDPDSGGRPSGSW